MTDASSADQPDDALGPLRTHLTATVDDLEAGLRAPTVLLLAFEGWNDAGDAASGALDALREQWDAAEAGRICDGEFYDYQVTRPVVRRDADGLGTLEWPAVRLHEAQLDAQGRPVAGEAAPPDGVRVLLAVGVEPNVRWQAFAEELFAAAAARQVDAVVTLGGVPVS